MGTNYKDYLKKQLQNPAFKAEYDALEPEYTIMCALIEARKSSGLTQQQLSLILILDLCLVWIICIPCISLKISICICCCKSAD